MSKEFVVIDDTGKERDWIDPVVSTRETKCYWFVENGYSSKPYKVFKHKGWQYIVREMKVEDGSN